MMLNLAWPNNTNSMSLFHRPSSFHRLSLIANSRNYSTITPGIDHYILAKGFFCHWFHLKMRLAMIFIAIGISLGKNETSETQASHIMRTSQDFWKT